MCAAQLATQVTLTLTLTLERPLEDHRDLVRPLDRVGDERVDHLVPVLGLSHVEEAELVTELLAVHDPDVVPELETVPLAVDERDVL